MFGQTDAVTWAQLLQENALVAFAVFSGGGLYWMARRFFGVPNGIITRLSESIVECNAKNSDTLVKLHAVRQEQIVLCARHVEAITAVNASMAVLTAWHAEADKPVVAHKIREALAHACDALEPLCAQYRPELVPELHAIKAKLE